MPIGELNAISELWNSINGVAGNSLCLDWLFVSRLAEFFSSGFEYLAVCEVNGVPIAAAIMCRKGRWASEVFAPAQAPMGAWVNSPEYAVNDLLASLLTSLPDFPLVLGVSRLDPDITPRPADSATLSTLDYIETGRIVCSDGFEAFWSERGKNLKHNLKRQRNKLAREGISTRLQVITDPGEIGLAVDDYGRLESSGWKSESGTAVHPDNQQGRFYRSLLQTMAERNEAIVYKYFLNEDFAACDLCVVRDNVLTILKTTHAESLQSLSPAHLMRQESFQKMFDDDGIRRVEFYGKRMEWHSKWTDNFRTMYHVTQDRWSFLSRFRRGRAT